MNRAQKKRINRGILGVVALTALVATWERLPLAKALEQSTVDYRYAKFNRQAAPSKQIVLIDVDEQSLKNFAPVYGRWPWPRRVYKDVIEFLASGEPSVILFDIMFTEGQLNTDDDQQLAEASSATGLASHAAQLLLEPAREGVNHVSLPAEATRFSVKWKTTPPTTRLLSEAGSSQSAAGKSWPTAIEYHDFALPNPALLAKTPRMHIVNVGKDQDGLLRRVPLLHSYDQSWMPSLTLNGLASLTKNPMLESKSWESGSRLSVYDGTELKWEIPLDSGGQLPLHFYDASLRPKVYPLGSVLESAAAIQKGDVEDPAKLAVNPFDLKDKIILIGASATGLEDLKVTPVSQSYPGVMLHATAISNILENDHLSWTPGWTRFALALAFAALAYVSVFALDHILLKTALPLGGLAGYAALAAFAFQSRSLALPVSLPIGVGLLAFLDAFVYMSFVEGRDKRRMTGTLSKYLSPEVARNLAENGIDPTAEIGQKRELSILFSDIRGFTTMSEQLKPEMVVMLLNEYLGKMTDLIFDNGGTLDKFIGDAVMAFWGAPLENPEHALHAVKTAMHMRERLRELNESWEPKGYPLFQIGIGINTGEVIVGNIGSEKRLDYTVIGDNVNLASRVEGLTKQYHVELLIGPITYEKTKHAFISRPIDLVKVKGKHDAVKLFEPLVAVDAKGPQAEELRTLASEFTAAWELYAKGDFTAALKEFNRLNATRPGGDGPSQVYAERCFELLRSEPPEWDGVYIAKSK